MSSVSPLTLPDLFQALPFLMLHGFPQTRYMWRHQVRAVAAAGFHALAPDQRGYSRGARPAEVEAYATDRLTGDALDLIDACGARRFHLVGHDWGGQLAWLIAAAHPHRVATLTVLSRPHPAAFVRALAEDPEQAKRSQHHKGFREPDAISRLRQDDFKSLRKGLEREVSRLRTRRSICGPSPRTAPWKARSTGTAHP